MSDFDIDVKTQNSDARIMNADATNAVCITVATCPNTNSDCETLTKTLDPTQDMCPTPITRIGCN